MKFNHAALCCVLLATPACAAAPDPVPLYAMDLVQVFPDRETAQLADAAARGDTDGIRGLTERGADPDARGAYGVTPLYWALQGGSPSGFEALLDVGANPDLAWDSGDTIVHAAAAPGRSVFMKLLLSHGVEIDRPGKHGEYPLHRAVSDEDPRALEMLIAAGANLNPQDADGMRPIITAAVLRQYRSVHRLLVAGADWRAAGPGAKDLYHFIRQSCTMAKINPAYSWRQQAIAYLRRHDRQPEDPATFFRELDTCRR